MKKLSLALAALAMAVCLPGQVTAREKLPELSASELAAVQSRTYPVSDKVVFSSAVAALQAAGYLGIEASKDAGTISGHTDAKSKLMFNIFWGLGKKKYTQTAQFLVEEMQPGQTTLRLNLFLNESKTRSIIFGNKATDAMLIRQGEPYTALLQLVDAEVARRKPLETKADAATESSDTAGTPASDPEG